MKLNWWKRPENIRLAASLVAALCGIALGVWALTLAQSAQGENRRDISDTQIEQLTTCQLGNRNRPQIAINTLIATDGILRAFGASVEDRQRAAAGAVEALRPELAEGRSIGPRDCNDDGRININDYYEGRQPPDLLGPDGLPNLEETP